MASSSPMVAQLEFSVRIRNRRNELGLDAKTVADQMGFSRNFLSAVENNRQLLANERLPALAEILQFDTGDRTELAQLLDDARQHGWWNDYAKLVGHNEKLLTFYGLEAGADTIEVYESMVVTGLLQTEEYAEALIRADPQVRAFEVGRYVELRQRRQRRLNEVSPPRLIVLLNEAAIRQEIGARGVLKRQLHHLLDQIDTRPGWLDVRVQPFEAPLAGIVSALTQVILGFDRPHLGKSVWTDDAEPGDAELAPIVYRRSLDGALTVEESVELIRHALRRSG